MCLLYYYYQSFIEIERENTCYQFRILRNLRIDNKDRLEEYSQSIEIDIHACTQSQEKLINKDLRVQFNAKQSSTTKFSLIRNIHLASIERVLFRVTC